ATSVLVGHALLADGAGPLGPITRSAVLAGYLGTVGPALVGALFFDPAVQDCSQCPPNPWAAGSAPALVVLAGRIGIVASAVVPTVLAGLLVRRLVTDKVPARRSEAPVLVPGIGYLLAASITSWYSVGQPFLRPDRTTGVLIALQAAALVCAALGALWPAVNRRLIRRRMAALVARADEGPGAL